MGVYIKGMEMPTSCSECKFFAWKRGVGQHCAVDDRITFHATIDGMDVAYERKGNCPLVPVPPHGRLIDADALLNRAFGTRLFDEDYMRLLEELVGGSSTIIPAEEGET